MTDATAAHANRGNAMRYRVIFAAALALAPAGALAQTAPAVPAPAPAAAPLPDVDPARLAAARPVIDRIWPLGTYARLMHGAMDQIMHTTMGSMYDMPMDQVMAAAGQSGAASDKDKGKTMGDMMAEGDPNYRQRMDATMKVMMAEMTRIMTEVEPDVREALAHAYARRFTVEQLGDLDRFFQTPTGAIYANESLMMMMGPDMMQAMQSFAPRLMREMPAIMAKAAEATKDLPPPPAHHHQ